MAKVKFSETQRFNEIKDAIVETCTYIATMNCDDFNNTDSIEDQVDAAFFALDCVFKDTSLGDTESRRAAKTAIYEVLRDAPKDGRKFNYIEENIDCSMVINDVLHMITCDSDEYEYEGSNAMYGMMDKLFGEYPVKEFDELV